MCNILDITQSDFVVRSEDKARANDIHHSARSGDIPASARPADISGGKSEEIMFNQSITEKEAQREETDSSFKPDFNRQNTQVRGKKCNIL